MSKLKSTFSKTSITLSKPQRTWLKRKCIRDDLTMSKIIRELIKSQMELDKKKSKK